MNEIASTKKQRFAQSWVNFFEQNGKSPEKYVQTSTVPNFEGSLEVIMFLAEQEHAGKDIEAKFNYVMSAYDDELRHKNNPQIEIQNWEFSSINY